MIDDSAEDPLPLLDVAAYEWMRDHWKRLIDEFTNRHSMPPLVYVRSRAPTTLCAMFADDKLFMSSSIRGGRSFVYMLEKATRKQQLTVQALKFGEYSVQDDEIDEEPDQDRGTSVVAQIPRDLNDVEADERSDSDGHLGVGNKNQANCAEALTLHLWSITNRRDFSKLNDFRLTTITKKGAVLCFAPCGPDGCETLLRKILSFDTDRSPSSCNLETLHVPQADLSGQKVSVPSIAESASGRLWLGCGAKCNGTGRDRTTRTDCYCTLQQW